MKLKIAVAQMNPVVGDYETNSRKILSWIRQAENQKADLIVFPECALSGYPVWDLANKKDFVEAGLRELQKIVKDTASKKIRVALGFIDQNPQRGARSINALAWIYRGKIEKIYAKRLLPTYDVFLEEIFFEPGTKSEKVSIGPLAVGLTVCEDIWDERYEVKPLSDLHKMKVKLVVNISASPYYRGVAKKRDSLLERHAKKYKFPILYVNQVGGQDDLIFDGRSLMVDEKGTVIFRAPAFQEGLYFYDWNQKEERKDSVPLAAITGQPAETYTALSLGLKDYCRKNGFNKVVVGLSGGIDSALVAAIAVDALGKESVKGVTMPGPYSSTGSWEDAEALARNLGIEFEKRPIKKMYDTMLASLTEGKKQLSLATENLQARLRGLELMFISNDENRLVLTTGNKSELAMGYCTLYGDMAGGMAVIGDVFKTDVYRLAWYRNSIKPVIPENTLLKPPSAELRPNQKDEDSLPPYDLLDEILRLYIEENKSYQEILKLLAPQKVNKKFLSGIISRLDHNEYKRRQTPPILRVTEKAWFGRRMPITNRFYL